MPPDKEVASAKGQRTFSWEVRVSGEKIDVFFIPRVDIKNAENGFFAYNADTKLRRKNMGKVGLVPNTFVHHDFSQDRN